MGNIIIFLLTAIAVLLGLLVFYRPKPTVQLVSVEPVWIEPDWWPNRWWYGSGIGPGHTYRPHWRSGYTYRHGAGHRHPGPGPRPGHRR